MLFFFCQKYLISNIINTIKHQNTTIVTTFSSMKEAYIL